MTRCVPEIEREERRRVHVVVIPTLPIQLLSYLLLLYTHTGLYTGWHTGQDTECKESSATVLSVPDGSGGQHEQTQTHRETYWGLFFFPRLTLRLGLYKQPFLSSPPVYSNGIIHRLEARKTWACLAPSPARLAPSYFA